MALEKSYNGYEVAELLGVDYETVLHLAQTREIASFRVGRLRRFTESAVRAYIDQHRDDNIVIALRPRISSPTEKED